MTTVLLLVVLVVLVALGVWVTGRIKAGYTRSNRVVPGVATSAPDEWAGAHTPEARLHRRIRDAVSALRTNPMVTRDLSAGVVPRIEQEALALDERLVAIATVPERRRDEALALIEAAVVDLEDVVADLATGTELTERSVLGESTEEIAERIRHLAEARAEVEALAEPGSDTEDDEPTPGIG